MIKFDLLSWFWIFASVGAICFPISGCGQGGFEGYTNDWLYPDNVQTVYVEMFDTKSLRRGHEYELTDAICKRVESETPYKIVSDRDIAETVLSGQLGAIRSSVLARDRFSGRSLENEAQVTVSVTWKNLETGELLINGENAHGSATYSTQLGQDFDYASKVAVNRAAERVVELMQKKW
ncbi:MAG: LPS assembly lipoprotein LptE [Planctomycetota bacterium]